MKFKNNIYCFTDQGDIYLVSINDQRMYQIDLMHKELFNSLFDKEIKNGEITKENMKIIKSL